MSVFSPINRFLQAIALSHASKDASVTCSMQNGPVFQAETIDDDVVAPIACLLFWCRPPAIFRTIALGVVDTVKAFSFWSFAHVGKELRKTIPCITDSNSSSTIIFPSTLASTKTTTSHCFPACVSGSANRSMSMTACWFRIASSHSSLLCRFLVRAASGSLSRMRLVYFSRFNLEINK